MLNFILWHWALEFLAVSKRLPGPLCCYWWKIDLWLCLWPLSPNVVTCKTSFLVHVSEDHLCLLEKVWEWRLHSDLGQFSITFTIKPLLPLKLHLNVKRFLNVCHLFWFLISSGCWYLILDEFVLLMCHPVFDMTLGYFTLLLCI